MFGFLIDTIFILFIYQIFQEFVGIPMGTQCDSLLDGLYLYSYEEQFI
jgi:hypothetical protein